MTNIYILDGHQPKLIDDFEVWAHWFETTNRTVAKTQVGKLSVSTVFLGFDHNFPGGKPKLFETMIFGKDNDYQERYSTWDEAVAGHKLAVILAGEI